MVNTCGDCDNRVRQIWSHILSPPLTPLHTHNRENTPPTLQTQHTPSSSPPPLPPTSVNTEDGVNRNSGPSTGGCEVGVSGREDGGGKEMTDCSVRENEAVTHSVGSREEGMKEGVGVLSVEEETRTQVMKEDQVKEVQRSKALPPTSQKQRSLTSLFSRQFKEAEQSQQVSIPTTAVSNTDHSKTLPPDIPIPAPKLSSAQDFLLIEASDANETVELTPLEEFQQKALQQMTSSQLSKGKGEMGGGREGEGEEEVSKEMEVTFKPLIPEDVISKLKDKPGEVIVLSTHTYPTTCVYVQVPFVRCGVVSYGGRCPSDWQRREKR